jgi:hypothetical protein
MQLRFLPLLFLLCIAPLSGADANLETREPIRLSADEKSHIHLEMRLFLSTVQMIVNGLASNDMKLVAAASQRAGMAAAHDVPAKLREKLPPEFKKLGHATHQGFDDLARDAESLGDASQAMKQLGQVMNNCVACHARFRLEATAKSVKQGKR